MHDLDRIQAESASADEAFEFEDAFEESPGEVDGEYEGVEGYEYEGGSDGEGSLGEDEEMEFAAELLAANEDADVDRTMQRIVDRPEQAAGGQADDAAEPPAEPDGADGEPAPSTQGRARRPRRFRRRPYPPPRGGPRPGAGAGARSQPPKPRVHPQRRKRRRGLLGKALRGIAKKALPIAGRIVGSALLPGVGGAAGAAIGRGVGKAFGLELEGLSAEDQQFEVARGVVRLGAAAAEELEQIGEEVDDETAARMAVIRASARHAPGVVPRSEPPRPAGPPPRGQESGRWVRRNGRIVLLGL